MSMFYFGGPHEPRKTAENDIPVAFEREFLTLKWRPDADEITVIHDEIARIMENVRYTLHSESEFDYLYENIPNRIRERKRGWVVQIEYYKRGIVRKDFIVRVLKSPLYEIEMQKAYDDAEMRKRETMRVSEVKNSAPKFENAKEESPKSMSDDEILKMFNRAKAEAMQNADVPPTVDGGTEPLVVALSDDDLTKENFAAKEKKDNRRKEDEMRMMDSYVRNLKKMKTAM